MDVSDTSETDQLVEIPEEKEVIENNQEEIQLSIESSYCRESVLKFDELCVVSNDLFARVQQLPVYTADTTRWKSLFFNAFSQFDKLWLYQQEQRQALDLRRYQIGEIGSRIAHLYLSYYLQTSQVKYLRESFAFYDAILKRDYFDSEVQTGVDASSLMYKKLRAYSRAIQVAFFLENFTAVQAYLTRLSDVTQKTNNEDYNHVISEFSSFLSSVCLPIGDDGLLETSPFETLTTHPVNSDSSTFSLGRAVLVGADTKQSRIVDFTIDHYRMTSLLQRVTSEGGEIKMTHFHKVSTFSLLEALSGISNALSPSQILFLYISGESTAAASSTPQAVLSHPSYTTNSILLSHSQQLFLEDLYPYLRHPLFLLIDSPGLLPHSDLSFPERFHQPFICLMSPPSYPTTIENSMTRVGGLLTLFLTSPLSGISLICGIQSLTTKLSHTALQLITQVEDIAFSSLSNLPNLPLPYKQLCTNNTLQYVVKRFLFFWACLRLHLGFKKECLPRCYPPIPSVLFHSSYFYTELYDLFSFLDVTEMFMSISHAMEL